MKRILFATLLLSPLACLSQHGFRNIDSIHINKINAAMGVHGNLWHKPQDSTPACEFPKGSGKHIGFAGALWIGGYQQNLLKVAAHLFYLDKVDYWPGPITDPAGQYSLTYAQSQDWARVWKVSRDEINTFLSRTTHTVSNTPASILEWPGQGNSYARGNGGAAIFTPMSDYNRPFAPFVDVNGNGLYEPLAGDYPQITGDQALWSIFTDSGPDKKRLTLTEVMGIEVRCLAYAYNRGSLADNMVFYEYEIINRLGYTYDSVSIGFFADLDIGYPHDDYVGYDSLRNLAITYNADPGDGMGQPESYGANMPLAGVRLLEAPGGGCANFKPASSFMAFHGVGAGFPAETLDPAVGAEFYNYMNGRFRNGDTLNLGGKHVAVGDPSDPSGNSECKWGYLQGDRRMILSSQMDSSFRPGQTIKFAIALVASEPAPGNGCPGLTYAPIRQVADAALQLYCNPLPPLAATVIENNKPWCNIYPNPANGQLYVDFQKEDDYQLVLSDVTGKKLISRAGYGDKFVFDVAALPDGVYLIHIQGTQESRAVKFVKDSSE